MTPAPPTLAETRALLKSLSIPADEETVERYRDLVAGTLEIYERTEELAEPRELRPTDASDRTVHGAVDPDEDPYNAWITRCTVAGADDGPLAGLSVGLKDNVSLAGVPMTCGSQAIRGYVPDIDATLVTRLLEAGATVTGKCNMDSFGFSALGNTSDYGAVRNPHDPDRLAGGSSGGSAVAVVTGDVDLAIGADQGGSIRHPASWSGCVGHKPTHGLIPYTGVAGLDPTVDHVGPLARRVETVAQCLTVVAGADPLDARQGVVPDIDYSEGLIGGVDDLEVGILEEGFGFDDAESVVEDAVHAAIANLEERGASVERVSVPLHREAYPVHIPLLIQGTSSTVRAGGVGTGTHGFYDTGFADFFARARDSAGRDLPLGLQVARVAGEYLADAYGARYYAKASNLRRRLRAAYDAALGSVDLLAMPTTPMRAFEYDPNETAVEKFEHGLDPQPNTSPFDVTGHPAISVPCAMRGGLPVGLQLVGRHFEDAAVLRAAAGVEAAGDWRER